MIQVLFYFTHISRLVLFSMNTKCEIVKYKWPDVFIFGFDLSSSWTFSICFKMSFLLNNLSLNNSYFF